MSDLTIVIILVVKIFFVQFSPSQIITAPEFSTVYRDPHKGFDIVNKAETDVFLELSCFFDDPSDIGNLTSGSSAFSIFILHFHKGKTTRMENSITREWG